MTFSNTLTYSSISSDNKEIVYNIDTFDDSIYRITNNNGFRVGLFEPNVTSGILKTMNSLQFKLVKNEDYFPYKYNIIFVVNGTEQDSIELNGSLQVFRLPLLLGIEVIDTEVSYKSYVTLTLTDTVENVFNDPTNNGFQLSFSTTKIRSTITGKTFIIQSSYIGPNYYLYKDTNEKIQHKMILNDSNIENLDGKILFNIIRCM